MHLTTDANGSIIGEQGHYSFGESWYESGTTSPFAFTSYQRDATAGLDYAVNRYYSHRIGRFQTTDPLDLISNGCSGPVSHRLFNPAQRTPQDANLYSYVVNDPANRTDPLGLFHLEIVDPIALCPWWDPFCAPCPWWDPMCSLAFDPIDVVNDRVTRILRRIARILERFELAICESAKFVGSFELADETQCTYILDCEGRGVIQNVSLSKINSDLGRMGPAAFSECPSWVKVWLVKIKIIPFVPITRVLRVLDARK